MLPTDADTAALCAAVYSNGSTPPVAWDHFDAGEDDGVCWAIKRLPGYDAVVLRGSVNFKDWIRDFSAAPIFTRIGHVHNGFHAGMEHAWADIRVRLKQPSIVTGHSLGAARAAILTGLMVKDGIPPVARVVFGEPKPGFQNLADIVARVPGRSYRNGNGTHHDLVTDQPLLPLEFIHPTPMLPVCAPPAANDPDIAFAWHHMPLYQVAVTPRLVPVSV